MIKSLLAIVFGIHPLFLIGQQINDTLTHDTIKLTEIVIEGNVADKSTPVSFQNISAREIRLTNFGQEPSFILAQTPSVSVSSDAGSYWGYSYIRLRGIDQTRINMTLNGVPLNEPEDQGVYFSNYPDFFQTLKNVQVQRGVGMSKNGTASYAGSIILESEVPDAKPEGTFYAGAGSFGSYRFTSYYNLPSTKGLSTSIKVSTLKSNGYKYHSGNRSSSFFINSIYRKNSHLLRLVAFAGNQRNELAWLGVPLDTLKRDKKYNRSSNENDNFTQGHIQLHYQYAITTSSKINTCIYYNYLKGNYDFDLNNFLNLPRTSEMYNYAISANFVGWFANYTASIKNFLFSSGIHLNHYTREHVGTEKTVGWLYSNHGYKDEMSGYIRGSYKLKKLTIYGDGQYRYANFRYQGDTKLPFMDWGFFNYNTGAVYQFNRTLNLYYSFGQTNREPTRNDILLGNDNLDADSSGKALFADIKPERVIDHEFGVRIELGHLTLNFNFYYMSFKNENVLNGEMGPTGLPLHSNAARSYRSGLEVDLKYRIANIWLTNNSSFSKNRIKESGESIKPVLSPGCIVNQNIYYQYKNASMGISGRYHGESYLDYGNLYKLPDFFTLDTRLTYSFNKVEISLSVNNITNNQYYSNGNLDVNGTPVYFVQAPINFFGGIKCTF